MAVVKANYVTRGKGERTTAKANIRYIQSRPGRDKEKLTRTLFGAADSMGRYEAYQFINDAPKGTLFYRLKLSPDPTKEDTKRDLNMQKLTRAMMQRLEKRLKTRVLGNNGTENRVKAAPPQARLPKRRDDGGDAAPHGQSRPASERYSGP